MINELNNLSDYIVTQIDEKNMQLSTIYQEVEERLKKYDHITKTIDVQKIDTKGVELQKEKTKEKDYNEDSSKGLDKSSVYYKILDLSNQGYNVNDIARQLNIGKGEIQLILGINR
jgi:DNA-binding NarL/FixJ family response regulator